ncbi:MAG: Rieske 2Fe-2S domain-containing protein [Cypionkella sp.]|nr:Rieske 2Fe-2S domain-containing protein [Cypionkella sp.]
MSWVAVALSRTLGRRPLRVMHGGTPVVLFRDGPAIRALPDRCPHRMAPLSAGKVTGGLITCPYHGWQFDGTGRCRAIPGQIGALPVVQMTALQATERDGIIFVAPPGTTAQPFTHAVSGAPPVLRLVESRTRGTVLDVAENILDATHTHYTHRGILRGLSAKRYTVRVDITGGPDWVEARYTGEDRQHGLVSALLDDDRSVSVGRFRAPGIAELEFWGKGGLKLSTTFHLRPDGPDHTGGIGILAGPRDGGLGHLKAALFLPFFRIALAQDRRILRLCAENAQPGQKPVIGPLDILRQDIALILSGQPPRAATTPRSLHMLL